jgi:hypothetical protein
MIRDDAQACLAAYQFAELLLGGFAAKPEQERIRALAAAVKLRDDVQPRYQAALRSPAYKAELIAILRSTRARLDQQLGEASMLSSRDPQKGAGAGEVDAVARYAAPDRPRSSTR